MSDACGCGQQGDTPGENEESEPEKFWQIREVRFAAVSGVLLLVALTAGWAGAAGPVVLTLEALALAAGLALATGAPAGAASTRAALAGSVPSWATSSAFKTAAAPDDHVGFRIYLPWRGGDAAMKQALAVSTPGSASYGKYLTPAQFRQAYAPTQADVGAVQVGQKASFTVSAYPQRRYPATVSRVAYGSTLTEQINEAGNPIKAMYFMGLNPVVSYPDSNHVMRQLEKLDFCVMQDIFWNESCEYADVVLPGTCFAEKDGTFTNTERRVQRIRKALSPVGQSRPDWMILCDLAARMGYKEQFSYDNPGQIMAEVARLAPSYGGISYDRLERQGLQWPCPNSDHPGTQFLHKGQFTRGLGKFNVIDYRPSVELPDEEYPFILTTGRILCHYHTGTMTRKINDLNILRDEELVEINPKDAQDLGIEDGELVDVTSRRGKVRVKAKTTEKSPAGVVFMTFHFSETPTNVLTNPVLDPIAKIPELKVCAVKLDKVRGG